MTNPSLINDSSDTPNAEIQGITEIRQKTIAALIARGFPVKYVAKKLKMSESRIYHLLSDRDSVVNAEVKRIFTELFASADGHLLNLYNKALQKLDTMLSSSDEENQYRAIDRIIKMFFARIPKNTIIQQYFGDQLQPQREFTITDYILFKEKFEKIILQRLKERGLLRWPDEFIQDIISEAREERGLPELPDQYIQGAVSNLLKEQGAPEPPDPKDGCDSSSHNSSPPGSSPENSTRGNALQDVPSQHAPSQRTLSQEAPSPNVPYANTPSPNHSSPEAIEEFIKSSGLDE